MTSDILKHSAQRPDPNALQQTASAPEDLVWVSASAGSGKTKVLTDRVLRLLLPDPQGRWLGTAPHRLLCITFTKAAAAEMALRVNKSLGRWAVLGESDLAQELQMLTGQVATPPLIAAARKLFADVLDCPGGLKILTIHSFCQSVLGRFPLEAGVNPDFTVLDEQMSQELLAKALDHSLIEAQSARDGDMSKAFRRLAVIVQLDDLVKNIRMILQKPELLETYVSRQEDLSTLSGTLLAGLGLDPAATSEGLTEIFISQTPEFKLRALIAALANGTDTLKDIAMGMQEWLDLASDERAEKIDLYKKSILTNKGTARKLGKFANAEVSHSELFERECSRYLAYQDQVNSVIQSELTASLMILARSVWNGYENLKKCQDALDYNDLIRKTDKLLQSTSGKWVHFKLDGGIDHILMDEAQDTNRHQWNIIRHLTSEIFDGDGASRATPRSLFVVGDKKQSIFSFQGADPEAFDRMQGYFRTRATDIDREMKIVPMEISFRTTTPVLSLVDNVFDSPELRRQIGLDPSTPLTHYSFRDRYAGLVELWPLITKPKKVKADHWELPFLDPHSDEAQESLAEQIASQVSFWLQKGEILESQGRPLTPGDILILVRTRTPLVHELVRQFKRRDIPVSGIDRLTLGDQIGVQDLLALARFVRLPDDEFSLACVLKSPLVGWDDDDLMRLALNRPETLWSTLKTEGQSEVTSWLETLIDLGRTAAPFEFLESILNHACPADPEGTGWRAMTRRLGHDVVDPLEELVSLALKLEAQGVRTLDDLILWQQKTDVQIKREMEEAGSQIRIMTVHASKGLEAPVVILPDTTSVPTLRSVDPFIWPDSSSLRVPLWAGRSEERCDAFVTAQAEKLEAQRAESSRLLYVALTRARDRLYIMGAQSGNSQAATWYSLVHDAFSRLAGVETLENGRKRLVSAQTASASAHQDQKKATTELPAPPAWLASSPQEEDRRPHPYTPSRGDDASLSASFHTMTETAPPSPISVSHPLRFQRGVITHKLFQFLPDLPDDRRADAAQYYVRRAGRDLSEDIQTSIVNETLTVLRDPHFAAVFGPGSLAEVPITGVLSDQRLINGQIDRLVITADEILIVDYKTNRPSPRSADEIPEIYRQQLRAYRDTLAQIYPNLLIKCALLWTDQPLLMPVPI